MGHIVIEHSSNLRERLNLPKFVRAIHEAALAAGIFPLGGMHTRAYEVQRQRSVDGQPDTAFVHLAVRVSQQEDLTARRRACEEIFAAACDQLRAACAQAPLGISVEMQELSPDSSLEQSNIHDYLRSRQRRAVTAPPPRPALRA